MVWSCSKESNKCSNKKGWIDSKWQNEKSRGIPKITLVKIVKKDMSIEKVTKYDFGWWKPYKSITKYMWPTLNNCWWSIANPIILISETKTWLLLLSSCMYACIYYIRLISFHKENTLIKFSFFLSFSSTIIYISFENRKWDKHKHTLAYSTFYACSISSHLQCYKSQLIIVSYIQLHVKLQKLIKKIILITLYHHHH